MTTDSQPPTTEAPKPPDSPLRAALLAATRTKKKTLQFAFGGLTVLLILVCYLLRPHAGQSPPPLLTIAQTEQQAAYQIQLQQNAIAQARCKEVLDQAKAVYAQCDQLDAEIKRWKQEILPLGTTDRGKYLASEPQYVNAFNVLVAKERPGEEAAKAYRDTLDILVAPLKSVAANTAFMPSDKLLADIKRNQQTVTDAVQGYRTDREALQTMLAQAEKTGRTSTQTLAEATTAEQEKFALELAQVIIDRQKEAQRKAAEIEGDALAEKQRILAEQKVATIQAETESAKAQAEQDRLRLLAARPDIQALYAPFLEKGRFRLNPETCRAERTDKPEPMSYSDLKALGVLDNYKYFAAAGGEQWPCSKGCCHRNSNDRPSWPFPRSEEENDKFKEPFNQFIQLAPIWAETGVLAP